MTKLELAKFLLTNVTGRIAAIITWVLSTLYVVAPTLPVPWDGIASRAQVACLGFLLALIFWRGLRREQLLTSAVATLTRLDPKSPNVSGDPGVQRAIDAQLAAAATLKK